MSQTKDYHAYTANDGATIYSALVSSSASAAVGFGWGAADATHAPLPRGFRMRVVYCADPATHRMRAVPCATPAAFAALLSAAGNTVSLPDDNVVVGPNWNVVNGREERRGPKPHLIH